MKKLRALLLNYYFNVIMVVILGTTVFFIFSYGNGTEIWSCFRDIQILWLLSGCFLAFFIQVVSGAVYKLLANVFNPDYPLGDGLVNSLIASWFKALMPIGGDTQAAQIYVYRKQGIRMNDAATALLMEFIIFQIVSGLTTFVFIVWRLKHMLEVYSPLMWLVVLGFIVDSFLIVVLIIFNAFPKLYERISGKGGWLTKLPFFKAHDQAGSPLTEQLLSFANAKKLLGENKDVLIKVVVLDIIRILLGFALPLVVLRALNIDLNFTMAIDIVVLSCFIGAINRLLPLPGGTGSSEAVFILFLIPLVGPIMAVSCALLWRLLDFYLIVLSGGLVFMIFKRAHTPRKAVF